MPARVAPTKLAAKARPAAKKGSADRRSENAAVQAAWEAGGTARARQRATCRMNGAVPHSSSHSSGYPHFLARRAICKTAPVTACGVSGDTRVISTATCALIQSRNPIAMTSMRRVLVAGLDIELTGNTVSGSVATEVTSACRQLLFSLVE